MDIQIMVTEWEILTMDTDGVTLVMDTVGAIRDIVGVILVMDILVMDILDIAEVITQVMAMAQLTLIIQADVVQRIAIIITILLTLEILTPEIIALITETVTPTLVETSIPILTEHHLQRLPIETILIQLETILIQLDTTLIQEIILKDKLETITIKQEQIPIRLQRDKVILRQATHPEVVAICRLVAVEIECQAVAAVAVEERREAVEVEDNTYPF